MFVAGTMAISNFPMAVDMAIDLAHRCNLVVLRFDTFNGNGALFRSCVEHAKDITEVKTILGTKVWNRWNWREDMLRALDNVKPAYVLTPDSDETFGPGFEEEFLRFSELGWEIMSFNYDMVTEDGREVPTYPRARHCKAFLWSPGLTFEPYPGYAKPNWQKCKPRTFAAETRMQHYCFYTCEMQQTKKLHK